MRIRHPETLAGVGGQCPDRVQVGGDTYDCGDGAAFDVPEREARSLAARYGVDVESIAADDDTAESDDSGPCEVVKTDGEVCGRERPCPYHD